MFISRFWTALLALAVGGLLAIVILGKDVVNRERVENTTAILYKEMTKVDVALKLHARKRLDVLLTVAVDPEVRRLFYSAASNQDKLVKVRNALLNTLRKKNSNLDKYTADLLIALNLKGEVICQVGKNEREHGYVLAGFPAVDAALRGYIRDDIWKLNNDVYLMAMRPVIEQGRYVGAIVHAMKVSDKLAVAISPSLQLAFFAGNTMVAVGSPPAVKGPKAQGSHIAQPLDKVLLNAKFQKDGYSEVQRIESSEDEFMAVYSRIRGEAANNNVGYALVASIDVMIAPTEFYEKAGTQDIDALPTAWLIIGVILVILIGWAWNYLEAERPVGKLLQSIVALEKSDPKDQLNIYRFRRKIRKVATAINALIDYKMRSILETSETSSETSSKSIDAILGQGDNDSRLSSASFKFVEPTASDVPPPPPVEGQSSSSSSDEPAPSRPITMPQEKLPPAVAKAGPKNRPPTPPSGTSAPQAVEAARPSPEEEQKYFKEIYQEFIDLKKNLGESVEQLTFERFLGTLKKNRDTLMARYDCQYIKFKVYEKDGKASLKATPVKD